MSGANFKLKISFIFAFSTLASVCANAAIEASTAIRQYDDSKTQVTTPSIDVSGTFNNDQMKISVGSKQDLLTSASADVETYSSKGVIDDHRKEYSASFETLIPDGTMSVGYVQSDEDDYHSRIVAGGGTREFFQKNSVVSYSFAYGVDTINSVSDPTFAKRMVHQSYSLSLTQVLSKVSLIQLIYDLRIESGFLASPYRQARLLNTATGIAEARDENHPLTRNRHAWAIRYNHYLQSLDLSVASTYRLYQDSWGVLSHTIEERFSKDFNKKWSGSLTLRYYTQQAAKFYSDYYYDTLPVFHTGNNTLAALNSYGIGIRPIFNINDKTMVYGKLEYFTQSFKDATAPGASVASQSDDKKIEISAVVLGLGLGIKF